MGVESAVQAVQGERFGRVAEWARGKPEVVIRWDDDGTTSDWIEASELDWIYPEVTVSKEDFAAACRAESGNTVVGFASRSYSSGWFERSSVSDWFEKLRLALVEERSCIADLCAACGL